MWGLGESRFTHSVGNPSGVTRSWSLPYAASTERVPPGPWRMTLTRGHVKMFVKWSQIRFAGYVGSTCGLMVLDCVDALHV